MPVAVIPPPGPADRLRRLAWQAVWFLLYRPSPVPLHGWRRALLRLFGARVAAGAHPYPSARVWAPWNLVMEPNACLGGGADCYNVARVTIGRDAVVSQKAYLCTAGHDLDDARFPLTGAPIDIGPGAWIAAGAFVGPGVTVGSRAVVAACAVAVRDVEPDVVVGGNPARFLRTRRGGAGDLA